MMSSEELLFSLLRNHFFGEPLTFDRLSHQEFSLLMRLARKQTVGGLTVGALIRAGISLDRVDAIAVFSRLKMIEAVNRQVDNELISLETILSAASIRHLVFKGQTLARLYPHPAERMPGDIDFYCDEVDFLKAVRLLEDIWGVEIGESESSQHREFTHNDVPFEMHFCMIRFNNATIRRYWERLLAEQERRQAMIGEVQVPILNPTLNVLYTFLHLYHHLVELGVGLRQFCDVLCLLHAYSDQIDGRALDAHLTAMGFRRAFCAVGWILVHRMGLPATEFPLPIAEKDKRYEQRILSIVFTGGNFGSSMHHTSVRSGAAYYVETLGIKLSHYRLFWELSRKEIASTVLKELPRKMWAAFYDILRRRAASSR